MNTKQLVTGLVSAVALVESGEKDTVYVVDQIGLIYKINPITATSEIFLDLRKSIVPLNPGNEERGLLGLAFSPNYKDNGEFFVFYSTYADRYKDIKVPYWNCISRFFVNNFEEEVLIRIAGGQEGVHNGGTILFGPDNYLYIFVGDGGPQKDPNNHAQNLSLPYGKILRIDVDTDFNYLIPSDNPFFDGPLPEIYALGLRNPWGASFDEFGSLFVADAGYKTREEISIVRKGDNLGWNIKEGTVFTGFNDEASILPLTDPIFEYPTHHFGKPGVIVGVVSLGTTLLFADYSGTIGELIYRNHRWELVRTYSVSESIKAIVKISKGIFILTSKNPGPTGHTASVKRVTPL